MNYFLIALYLVFSICFLLSGFSYKNGKKLLPDAKLLLEERQYWEQMEKKSMKGFFVGAAGGTLAAIAIAIGQAIAAEVGCITLMAANVFLLAALCKKTAFTPSEETKALQKKRKILFLALSFAALWMTQLVFQYFNMLLLK